MFVLSLSRFPTRIKKILKEFGGLAKDKEIFNGFLVWSLKNFVIISSICTVLNLLTPSFQIIYLLSPP